MNTHKCQVPQDMTTIWTDVHRNKALGAYDWGARKVQCVLQDVFVASDVKEEMETTKVQSRFKGLRTVTTPIVTCFDRLP